MHVTETDNTVYIRLMGLRCQRIAQKDHQIDLIVFDLCAKLLCAFVQSKLESL